MKKYSDNISEGCRERLWSVEIFGQLTCLWLDKEKFYDEIFMLFLSSENIVRSAYIDFWQIFITNRWRGGKIDENFRDGMKSKSQNLTMKFYLPLSIFKTFSQRKKISNSNIFTSGNFTRVKIVFPIFRFAISIFMNWNVKNVKKRV